MSEPRPRASYRDGDLRYHHEPVKKGSSWGLTLYLRGRS